MQCTQRGVTAPSSIVDGSHSAVLGAEDGHARPSLFALIKT
jgi:hypothetical protein